jgi:hypothetical protein
MEGLGFKVTYGPLDFPYLDRDAMAQFRPPSLDGLAVACDVVILNDWHKLWHLSKFHQMALEDRAAEWETFLRELEENYPPQVFAFKQTPDGLCVTGCNVSRQEIYDLRPHDRASVEKRN